jgi:hypothetical protein
LIHCLDLVILGFILIVAPLFFLRHFFFGHQSLLLQILIICVLAEVLIIVEAVVFVRDMCMPCGSVRGAAIRPFKGLLLCGGLAALGYPS